jgi:pSer/pThr/pTyr-binding forkhead associated (FHA) protein
MIVMGTGAMLSIPNKDEVLIGRGDPHVTPPDVDLGPYGGGQAGVSRHHAMLIHTPTGFLLDDLNSTNGTFIGESAVQRFPLLDGDEIRLGSTVLQFTTSPPRDRRI